MGSVLVPLWFIPTKGVNIIKKTEVREPGSHWETRETAEEDSEKN